MIYGVQQTVTYIAWDTAANAGKTGDGANHTLRWIKNGTSAAPTNSPSEVDATNAPGVYKITLTATEWETLQGTLAGASSTAGVAIIPQQFTTIRAPNAAPGGDGGMATVNASNYVAGVQGTINTLDALDTAQDAQHSTTQSAIGGLNDLSQDQVNAACDTALADYDAVVPADLPTNFGSLAINASGHVERVTLVDTVTSNTDMRGTDGAALAATALSNATWTDARASYLDNLDGHTAQTGDSYAIVNSGTHGNAALKDLLDTVDGIVDAIKTNTDDLADGARLDLLIDAIKAKTDAMKDSWNDLGASDVRDAVGLAAANLDTQLSAISGYVDCLPATLDGSTFTELPAVTTDAASREASKADVSGLATSAAMTAAFAEIKGDDWTSTTDTLQEIRAATCVVSVTPISVTVSSGQVSDSNITVYQGAAFGPFVFTITDDNGDAVDLGSSALKLSVYAPEDTSSALWSITSGEGKLTVGGASNNQVTASDDDTNTGTAGVYRYVLWDTTTDAVRARGVLTIEEETA